MAELAGIRERGYGESREEFGKEAASLAFPVLNRNGEIVASLSIQSTVNRLNDKTRPKFLKEGFLASERISRLLA